MEKPGAFVGFCDASKAYAGRYPVWVSATKLTHQTRVDAAPEKIDEMKQRVSHMEAELRGCVADMKEIRAHADCLPKILELLRPLEGAAIDGPTAE